MTVHWLVIMSTGRSPQIAGCKTADDWRVFRQLLAVGGDEGPWREAVKEYFRLRLLLRYLEPIQILQREGTCQGEGFSIVAIQCTLVEFLESTVRGLNYRYVRPPQQPGAHEYNKSGDLFVGFLTTRSPFSREFDEPTAQDFYAGVRCGLLHEAQTKNGWRVHASSATGQVIDKTGPIVYRNNFQKALEEFVEWYCGALPGDANLQAGFLRKFDNLSS